LANENEFLNTEIKNLETIYLKSFYKKTEDIPQDNYDMDVITSYVEKTISDAINFECAETDIATREKSLEDELEEKLEDLDFLKKEKELINNPDHLGETVMNVVWEQFMNQVAATAGEEFISENYGLHLDLRDSAHIQTAGNFAEGKIAAHNHVSKEQLEQNYDRYKYTPHKEFRVKYVDSGMDDTLKRAGELKKQGIDTVTDIYTGEQIPTETKLANGKNNPKAAQREHVEPSAKLYKNPALQMSNSNEELAAIINNPENLQGYTTAERNNRKSDKSADEMDDVDKTEHWKRASEKAEAFVEKKEKEGEKRLKHEGRKSQKEEVFRIGEKALRTALMSLFLALVKEIIGKLVLWLKSAEKSLSSLLEYVKVAIRSFIGNFKSLLVNASDSVITTIITSIVGPVVGTIKKVFTLLKQGWKSLKEAIQYLRKPENKGKPLSQLLPQVGIIVVSGLSGIGAIVLGEFIEKGLIALLPALGVDIPVLGSPANLIGMLMGAIVCGVIGAIAINLINKYVAKQQKSDILSAQIDTQNKILSLQNQLTEVKAEKLDETKASLEISITARHTQAGDILARALNTIYREEDS